MIRARILAAAVAALISQGLALPRPATAQGGVRFQPQDVEQTRFESAFDGTIVAGGHLGVRLECTPGPQAYVEKSLADGTEVWLLSANAGQDCDGDGDSDGPGDPLFEGMTSLDPEYIMASTVHGIAVDASGFVYFTGQLLVAWQNGSPEDMVATWGAFVLRLTPEGELVGDAYFGAQPEGEPAAVTTCVTLCAALAETAVTQFGGRAVTVGEGVVVAGWKRSATEEGVSDKDVFVSRLSEDLGTTEWILEMPMAGDDEVLSAAFSSFGDVFVTGHFGPQHDVFVARLDGSTGAVGSVFTAGGPLDDAGTSLRLEEPVAVEVSGYFTDSAVFAGHTLEGDGPTSFTARLTPALSLLSVESHEPGGGGGGTQPPGRPLAASPGVDTVRHSGLHSAGSPPRPAGPPAGLGGTQPPAVDNWVGSIDVVVGEAGTGTSPALVARSDDTRLILRGQHQAEGDLIKVLFDVEIDPLAPKLRSVKLELSSYFCTSIAVSLGGGLAAAGELHRIGATELCPLDEPIIEIDVPPAIAQTLGFWESVPADSLVVELELVLRGVPCDSCQMAAKQASVDQISVKSEF